MLREAEMSLRPVVAVSVWTLLMIGCHEAEEPPEDPPLTSMVTIPAGNFWMGCNAAHDPYCGPPKSIAILASEFPYHEVVLDSYEIDITEVTVGQFRACVRARACSLWHESPPRNWDLEGRDEYPMDGLSGEQAEEYCAWAGKRLCTEAEWEKAARGGCEIYPGKDCPDAMPVYPWGNQPPSCDLAQVFHGAAFCGGENLRPVGTLPAGASPYGVLDMAGNVGEWVSDLYAPDYYCHGDKAIYDQASVEPGCSGSEKPFLSPWPNPKGPTGASGMGVLKGGSVGTGADVWTVRSSRRAFDGLSGGMNSEFEGTRCCRSQQQ